MSSSSDSFNTSQDSFSPPPPPPPQFNLPIPPPIYVGRDEGAQLFYGVDQLNTYEWEVVTGSAGGTNIYRGKLYRFGISKVFTVAYRRLNLELDQYGEFVTQINKQRQVNNPNLLALKEEINDRGRMWLVFEYLGPSLRGLYPNGASLPVLAHALYVPVKALVSIHENNLVHGQVDVGHMYKRINPPYEVKLGFGATVYEDIDAPKAHPKFLPSHDTCTWAAAPEVYYDNSPHTSASDIWQVGITALELALGNLWVKRREDLNTLIVNATVWEEGVFANADFQKFLEDCLHDEPDMRPTSEQLMSHPFFTNNIDN